MAADHKDLPRHYYTLEEYFALERTGDARYEYWDGEIICMSGGSRQHAMIGGNLYFRLRAQLTADCQTFNADMPIRTPALPPYRYPDASVACGEIVFENINGIDVLTNPILIVEVLSPGTEHLDRKEKRAAYQSIPSVMELLLISQDAPIVTQFLRPSEAEAKEWEHRYYDDPAAVIELPSINCSLSLRDVYDGIDFN
ncbi:MAG: Uma2 family endonuclease [Acidobacteriota bacterium]